MTVEWTKGIGRSFAVALPAYLLLEIVSLLGFSVPWVNDAGCIIIVVGTAVLAFRRLDLALLVLLGELFVGSQGGYHLYIGAASGLQFSLRMGLWLAIVSVWAARSILTLIGRGKLDWLAAMRRAGLWRPLLALFAVLAFAAVNGFFRGNGPSDVFFDANGFAYLALFPAFFAAFASGRAVLLRVGGIMAASVAVSSLKALLTEFIFSHRLSDIALPWYIWIRDARVGEITRMVGDHYRVFFQSQLFAIVLAVMSAMIFAYLPKWRSRNGFVAGAAAAIAAAALLLGLSRSFWFGLFAAALTLAFWLIRGGVGRGVWLRLIGLTAAAVVAGSLLIVVSYALPWPQKGASISLTSVFGDRFALSGEAAANSRWALLPVLTKAALIHPIIGSGFGTSVIYKTSDPRLLADIPTGEYATYAFEWGYSDLWLKFGLVGLAVYGWLIWMVMLPWRRQLKQWLHCLRSPGGSDCRFEDTQKAAFAAAVYAVMAALLATNVFSPYLNHPLGIGLIMLIAVVGSREAGLSDDHAPSR